MKITEWGQSDSSLLSERWPHPKEHASYPSYFHVFAMAFNEDDDVARKPNQNKKAQKNICATGVAGALTSTAFDPQHS